MNTMLNGWIAVSIISSADDASKLSPWKQNTVDSPVVHATVVNSMPTVNHNVTVTFIMQNAIPADPASGATHYVNVKDLISTSDTTLAFVQQPSF